MLPQGSVFVLFEALSRHIVRLHHARPRHVSFNLREGLRFYVCCRIATAAIKKRVLRRVCALSQLS